MTERADMEAVIEAILFVSNDPVSRDKLTEVFGENERDEAKAAIDAVVERFRERDQAGVVIDEVAGGLRLVSRPDLHGYLRRFFEVTGTNKLSMAALETLAIIAYRQPVTAPEVQELRGVSSQGVIKTLLERRLIRIAGRKEVVGKPFLYATTREFLLHFGLRSLKELPPLEQFEEMFAAEELASELQEPDQEEQADQEALELAEKAEDATDEAEAEQEAWEAEEAEEADIEDDDEQSAEDDAESAPVADGSETSDAVEAPEVEAERAEELEDPTDQEPVLAGVEEHESP